MLHHHVAMSYTKGPFDRVASKMRVRLLRYIRSQTRLKNMGVSSCFHWCYQCRHIGISLHHLLSQVHHIPLEETPVFWVKILSCRERSLSFTQWTQKDLRQAWSSRLPTSFEPGVNLLTRYWQSYLRVFGNWKIKENSIYWDASGLLPSTASITLVYPSSHP